MYSCKSAQLVKICPTLSTVGRGLYGGQVRVEIEEACSCFFNTGNVCVCVLFFLVCVCVCVFILVLLLLCSCYAEVLL